MGKSLSATYWKRDGMVDPPLKKLRAKGSRIHRQLDKLAGYRAKLEELEAAIPGTVSCRNSDQGRIATCHGSAAVRCSRGPLARTAPWCPDRDWKIYERGWGARHCASYLRVSPAQWDCSLHDQDWHGPTGQLTAYGRHR